MYASTQLSVTAMLTPHQIRALSVAAMLDPRTVTRWLAGMSLKPGHAARLIDACTQLGITERPPVSDASAAPPAAITHVKPPRA